MPPNKANRYADWALIALAAAAGAWALASVFARAPASQFVPAFSDEVFYYKQAAGFIARGFLHGYWGDSASVARVGGCDTHGCGFMIVQGVFGKVFGWSFGRALGFNFACLLTAFAAVFALVKPRGVKAAFIVLLLLTSGVVVTYSHAVMQEVFHASGAVVLAVAAWRFSESKRPGALAIYFAVGVLLSLVRITWGLYLPLAALLIPGESRARRLRIAAIGCALTVLCFAIETLTIPGGTLLKGFSLVTNVKALFNVHLEPLYLLFHATWLLLLALPAFLKRSPTVNLSWAALILLSLLQLLLYDCASWRDYRVLTPPLIALITALCCSDHLSFARLFLLFQLCCLPIAVAQAHEWNQLRPRDRVRVAAQALPVSGGSRWCRTVAAEMPRSPLDYSSLLSIPDGFGIQPYQANANQPARFMARLNPYGGYRLYENPKADCP